ncbi:rho guanine nucleotide exchange factor 11-like [Electrophorus electricus]|uniref:rho guanine nucleotide exchange factor 11-like n=1 Tax=Electrophorus electricus TaxID=8005 RepID=UPI0015CFFC23|nr:rho guanine nucleotide exchange factor 11-like [Electrophorus electricus]
MLVLLQRGSGDRLILRCPARSLGGVWGRNTDLKTPFCPVVRLDSSLVRSVATDNKALYVISTSERQIYELVAGTSSEKNTWKNLLEKTISSASGGSEATKQGSTAIPTDQSEAYMHTGGQGYVGGRAKMADAALQDEF